MGASVIALSSAQVSGAQAAEWDLDWGGFFGAWVAYSSDDGNDTNSNDDGFDVIQNSEIIFSPSITLDNGLTFGASIELEGNSGPEGDRIDESRLFVRGSFGRVELGSEDSAFNRMAVTGPIYGPAGTASGTLTGTFFQDGFGGGGNAAQLAGDAMRINYFTPRFAGFQVGVSYARDASEERRTFLNTDTPGNRSSIFSAGLNYGGSFGSTSVDASLTYEQADDDGNNNDFQSYGAGVKVGFGGFAIGGSYAHYEQDNSNNDLDFFHAGVGYGTGPWRVSLDGSYTDADNSYETTQFALNGDYKLGPGVKAQAFVGYADRDNNAGADFDGFAIGTGIRLDF